MSYEDSLFSFEEEAELFNNNSDVPGVNSSVVESKFDSLVDGLKTTVKLAAYTGNIDLLESYTELLIINADPEMVQEGANAEYTDSFKTHFKAANKYARQGKKYFKACSFKTAKEYYQKANKEIQDMQKEFDKVDDTVLSSIIGLFIDCFVIAIPIYIAALTVCIPYVNILTAGPYIAVVGAAEVQELIELINLIKNWKNDDIVKNLNFYRNKLDSGMKVMQSGYLKKIKQCDQFMKAK